MQLRLATGGSVGCGLKNLGNSCYINAVMQCLAVIDECKSSAVVADPEKFVAEYENLFTKLCNGRDKVVCPSKFKRALGKVDSRFDNTHPQDAEEFLSCVLARLKERRVGGEGAIEEKARGQLLATMCCSRCPYTSPAVDGFSCLSIQIRNGPSLLIDDCVEDFLGDEEMSIEDGWRCRDCCEVMPGTKTFSVVKSPKLLIIHLKRFSFADGQGSKIVTEVGIGTNLEVAGVQYKLIGLVKHQGSKESGHYVAVIQTSNGWLECNDVSVRRATMEDLHWCPDAYILFYTEVKSSPVPDTFIDMKGPRHV